MSAINQLYNIIGIVYNRQCHWIKNMVAEEPGKPKLGLGKQCQPQVSPNPPTQRLSPSPFPKKQFIFFLYNMDQASVQCYLCHESISKRFDLLKQHYSICALSHKKLAELKKTRIIIDRRSICLKCGERFEDQQWSQHSKRQKCFSVSSSSILSFSGESRSMSASLITSSLSGSMYRGQIEPSLFLGKKLGNIAKQFVEASTGDWVKLNKGIDYRTLTGCFTARLPQVFAPVFCQKMAIITRQEIKKLRIKMLYDVPLEDFLIPTKVDEIINKLSPSNSLKFIKFMNKKARQFKMFSLRPQPRLNRVDRGINPVRILDLLKFFESIFKTKKQTLLKIGLDFLIIFQTGVRWKSDYEVLQHAIQISPTNIKLKINKTGEIARIVLPDQTLKLIQMLKWNGWNRKTFSLFKCMRSWSGFFGYSMKYTLLSFLYFVEDTNSSAKLQTGHSTMKHLKRYVLTAQLNVNRQNIAKIEVPGVLQTQNTWELVEKINHDLFQGLDEDYCQVSSNFLDNLIQIVYHSRQQFEKDTIVEITSQPPTQCFYIEKQRINEKNEQKITNNDLIEDEQESNQSSNQSVEQMIVFGKLVQGNMEASMYQVRSGQEYCIFCNQVYNPPLCSCLKMKIPKPLAIKTAPKPLDINIAIPDDFFRRETDPQFLRIRRLIALRRFSFCQQASCIDLYSASEFGTLMSWSSEEFRRLRNEIYFPPLELFLSGGMYLKSESSFGLRAKALIKSHTLIGQYATDIVDRTFLHNCRRLDTAMILDQDKKLTLTPVINMGIVCLLNCSCSDSQKNCQSLKIEINGQLKIIIYTIKDISPSQQLLYDYGQSYNQNFSNLSIRNKKKNQVSKPNTSTDKPAKIPKRRQQKNSQKTRPQQPLKKNDVKLNKLKRLKKAKVQINECFADVVYYVIGQIYNEIPSEISDRPSTIQKFLEVIRQRQETQQDAIDFFTFIHNSLKEKSVFAGSRVRQSKICNQNCGVVQTQEDVLYLQVGRSKISFEKSVQVEDFYCPKCQRKTIATSTDSLIEAGKFLIIVYPRLSKEGQTMKYIAHRPTNLVFKSKTYELSYLILFYGRDNNGHYVVSDRKLDKFIGSTEDPEDKFNQERLHAYISFYVCQT